jgi:hypothetical protein
MDGAQTAKAKAEEARQKADRLALAFRMVFGAESKRTDAQRLVWSTLEQLGYRYRSTMVPDENGSVCAMRTASAEGHRQFFLQIEELVRRASEVGETPAKPDVRKE